MGSRVASSSRKTSKDLVGTHLLRARIREKIFVRLEDVAEIESSRTGEHVTVSDLVRIAIYNYLLPYSTIEAIESASDTADPVKVVT